MKAKPDARRELHLVTAEEASSLAQQQRDTPVESNRFLAALVQDYRQLKEELAGLGDNQDRRRITALQARKDAVSQCLAAYGVHVGA